MSYFSAWQNVFDYWCTIKGKKADRRAASMNNLPPDAKCAACSVSFDNHGYDGRTRHWFVPPIKETK